jgi:O-antigen ligase
MTEIAITTRRSVDPRIMPAELWSRQSAVNDRLAWALLAVIALAPLPFGSTPPFFMAVWAVLIGLAGAMYATAIGRSGEKLRYGVRHLWFEIALFSALALYIVVQALPLGTLPLPDSLGTTLSSLLTISAPGGTILTADTISLTPGDSWHTLLRFGTYGVLFFLMLQVATNTHRRALILRALLFTVTAYAIYGMAALYQFGDTILGLPKTAYLGSATGPFINRNAFGCFLSLGAVLALSMTISPFVQKDADSYESSARRSVDPIVLIYGLCFLVLVAALLLTQSRMALFAMLCGGSVVILANLFRSRSPWMASLLLIPMGLVVVGAAVYTYGQGVMERFGSTEQSLQVRFSLYDQVIAMIIDRPWLGYGAGSFPQAFQLFHQPPVSTNLVWDKAHDTYLGLWSELGVVAGSIPVVVIAILVVRVLAGMQRVRSDWTAKVAALAAVIVGAVHSLTDFPLEIPAVAMLLTALLAVGVSGVARRTNEAAGAL